jgi:hypothetical protein
MRVQRLCCECPLYGDGGYYLNSIHAEPVQVLKPWAINQNPPGIIPVLEAYEVIAVPDYLSVP